MRFKKALLSVVSVVSLFSAVSAHASWYLECRGHTGQEWQFIPAPNTDYSPQQMNIGNRWYTVDDSSADSCSLSSPGSCSNYSFALLQMEKASLRHNWGINLQWTPNAGYGQDCYERAQDKAIPVRVMLVRY